MILPLEKPNHVLMSPIGPEPLTNRIWEKYSEEVEYYAA